MKMVNGRVDERSAAHAAQVLKEHGLTISSFIRNSIEHIARTGEVPESGMGFEEREANLDSLRAIVKDLESRPMPGKRDYAGLGEDDLLDRLRMERYGY